MEQLLAHAAKMPAYTQFGPERGKAVACVRSRERPQSSDWRSSRKRSVPQRNRMTAWVTRRTQMSDTPQLGQWWDGPAGTSWEELVRREIARPLGMKGLGFGYPATTETPNQPRGHSEHNWRSVELSLDPSHQLAVCLWPAGADCIARSENLALYTADHLNGLRGRRALLPQTMYQRLHRPLGGGDNGSYSLGWGVRPDERWGVTRFRSRQRRMVFRANQDRTRSRYGSRCGI